MQRTLIFQSMERVKTWKLLNPVPKYTQCLPQDLEDMLDQGQLLWPRIVAARENLKPARQLCNDNEDETIIVAYYSNYYICINLCLLYINNIDTDMRCELYLLRLTFSIGVNKSPS